MFSQLISESKDVYLLRRLSIVWLILGGRWWKLIHEMDGGRGRWRRLGERAWSIICWAVRRWGVLAANRTHTISPRIFVRSNLLSTETTFRLRSNKVQQAKYLLLFWNFAWFYTFLRTLFLKGKLLHPSMLSEVKAQFGKTERGSKVRSLTDHLQDSMRGKNILKFFYRK